jgi:hypothetical protein
MTCGHSHTSAHKQTGQQLQIYYRVVVFSCTVVTIQLVCCLSARLPGFILVSVHVSVQGDAPCTLQSRTPARLKIPTMVLFLVSRPADLRLHEYARGKWHLALASRRHASLQEAKLSRDVPPVNLFIYVAYQALHVIMGVCK